MAGLERDIHSRAGTDPPRIVAGSEARTELVCHAGANKRSRGKSAMPPVSNNLNTYTTPCTSRTPGKYRADEESFGNAARQRCSRFA